MRRVSLRVVLSSAIFLMACTFWSAGPERAGPGEGDGAMAATPSAHTAPPPAAAADHVGKHSLSFNAININAFFYDLCAVKAYFTGQNVL